MPTLAILMLLSLSANDLELTTGGGVTIQMRITPLPAFTGSESGGRKPVVYAGGNQQEEVALSTLGYQSFVGSAALVRYEAPRGGGRKVRTLRERVVLLGQSPGLPERADFHKEVPFVKGVASDIQLFGYDEATVTLADRAAAREQSKALWRRFRQELFLDKDPAPFAVLVWVHTMEGIRLESASPRGQ